jgi:hypothetical protein
VLSAMTEATSEADSMKQPLNEAVTSKTSSSEMFWSHHVGDPPGCHMPSFSSACFLQSSLVPSPQPHFPLVCVFIIFLQRCVFICDNSYTFSCITLLQWRNSIIKNVFIPATDINCTYYGNVHTMIRIVHSG